MKNVENFVNLKTPNKPVRNGLQNISSWVYKPQ